MEVISVANLPKGTRKKLESIAVKQGHKKKNGTGNISDYVRKLLETAIAINS